MNWTKIKTDYPKAWNILIQYSRNNEQVFAYLIARYELGMEENEVMSDFNLRDLYDFFDENNLHVLVYFNMDMYQYDIIGDSKNDFYRLIHNDSSKKLRSDIELIAFEKAFEILNNKLKSK